MKPAHTLPPPLPRRPVPGIQRVLGWLLIVLGVGLSVGMTAIAYFLQQTIAHDPGPGGRGSHWNGSAEFTRTTFELFATVFLFGLVGAGAGAFQVRHGRAQPALVVVLVLLVVVMAYLVYGIVSAPTSR